MKQMIKKPCLIYLQFFCSHIPVLKSSTKMAKACVKMIYLPSCLPVANLLLLIALSAIGASLQVNDLTELKGFSKFLFNTPSFKLIKSDIICSFCRETCTISGVYCRAVHDGRVNIVQQVAFAPGGAVVLHVREVLGSVVLYVKYKF